MNTDTQNQTQQPTQTPPMASLPNPKLKPHHKAILLGIIGLGVIILAFLIYTLTQTASTPANNQTSSAQNNATSQGTPTRAITPTVVSAQVQSVPQVNTASDLNTLLNNLDQYDPSGFNATLDQNDADAASF